ncbi:MAG: hypothetical protein PHS60_12650 [Zavarzinia sp.]|nr:hypothetical protein [Zavarzinia sp.]
MTLADFVLRPIGFFYLVTAFLTIRALVMGSFLDRALAAIAAGQPPRAERLRSWWLIVATTLIAFGGAALMLLWEGAVVLFCVNAAAQVFYIAVAAPRWFDPGDPPNPLGRAASRQAMVIYVASSALVLVAWNSGVLLPFSALSPLSLTLTALLLAFGLLTPLRQYLAGAGNVHVHSATAPAASPEPEVDMDDPPPPLPNRLVLTPSFTGTGVRDEESNEDVPIHVLQSYLPFDLCQRIEDWMYQFSQVADRDDPRRCSVANDIAWDRVVSEGEAIYGQMVAILGPAQVHYQPLPSPVTPTTELGTRVELRATYLDWPIRDLRPEGTTTVAASELGLSFGLVNDLEAWTDAFEHSFDPAVSGDTSTWPAERLAEHHRQGRDLAERLRRELAATGRGDVEIIYRED